MTAGGFGTGPAFALELTERDPERASAAQLREGRGELDDLDRQPRHRGGALVSDERQHLELQVARLRLPVVAAPIDRGLGIARDVAAAAQHERVHAGAEVVGHGADLGDVALVRDEQLLARGADARAAERRIERADRELGEHEGAPELPAVRRQAERGTHVDADDVGIGPASWNGLGERSASEPESKPLSPLNDAPEALEHDAVATTAPPTRALSER